MQGKGPLRNLVLRSGVFAVLLFVLVGTSVDAQDVTLNLVGPQFPISLPASSTPVDPHSQLRDCGSEQLTQVRRIVDAIQSMASRAPATPTSASVPALDLTFQPVPGHDHASLIVLRFGDTKSLTRWTPALYNCLSLVSGSAVEAARLGLFVRPKSNQSPVPVYSPQIGLYVVTDTPDDGSRAYTVRVDMTGPTFPGALVERGAAIDPRSSLRSCDPDELNLVRPIVQEVASLVRQQSFVRHFNGVQSAEVQPEAGISVSLVRAPLGMYAIDIHATTVEAIVHVIPAMYHCLVVTTGTADKAEGLGLFLTDASNATPIYSPALGFYRAY